MIDRGEPKAGVKDESQIDQNRADQQLSSPRKFFNITKDTIFGFLDDDCLVLAGAVAFSAVQSLVPLVIGFISVGSLLLQDPQTRLNFIGVMIAAVPPELSSVFKFEDLINNFINGAGLAGVISVLVLLWTGSGVFGQLKYATNRAFRVEKDLRNPILQTGIQLLMLLFLGGLLIVAFLVNILFGLFFNLKISIFGMSPFDFSFLLPVLSYLIPYCLESAVFSLIYKFSPARKGVRWKPVIMAGLITGILFELLKQLFNVYVVLFNAAGSAAKTYGAIGGIFVFLFFLFLAANVILLGAELAARLHNFPEGLATAKSKEALVEIPAEDIQSEMVPRRFAPAVREAEVTGEATGKEIGPPSASLGSVPTEGGSVTQTGGSGSNGASVKNKAPGPEKAKPSGRVKPPKSENRLAMVTGSIVLVVAAVIGYLFRRKPPANL